MIPVVIKIIDGLALQRVQVVHHHGIRALEGEFALLATQRTAIVTNFTLREWSPETARLVGELIRSMELDASAALQGANRPESRQGTSPVEESSASDTDEAAVPGTINHLAEQPENW